MTDVEAQLAANFGVRRPISRGLPSQIVEIESVR